MTLGSLIPVVQTALEECLLPRCAHIRVTLGILCRALRLAMS